MPVVVIDRSTREIQAVSRQGGGDISLGRYTTKAYETLALRDLPHLCLPGRILSADARRTYHFATQFVNGVEHPLGCPKCEPETGGYCMDSVENHETTCQLLHAKERPMRIDLGGVVYRCEKGHVVAIGSQLFGGDHWRYPDGDGGDMKIRLMGPPDIVRGWGKMIEAQFGVTGDEYATRGRGNAIRYYIDIDDRMAAEILNRSVVADEVQETAQLAERETSSR